jgi:hypothetical protein
MHVAKWVPLVAIALALPGWTAAQSNDAKQNTPAVTSDQGNAGSDTKSEDQGGAAKNKAHGPTAVMDRATPTQKSVGSQASKKHPPTAQMDRATPSEKSAGSKGSGDNDANTENTEVPSSASKPAT